VRRDELERLFHQPDISTSGLFEHVVRAVFFTAALTAATIAVSAAGSSERMSSDSSQAPGIAVGIFGCTSTNPVVQTTGVPASAMRRAASRHSMAVWAAARNASRRVNGRSR